MKKHTLTPEYVYGKQKVTVCEESADAHRDISEGCPHHEVEDPGLQLEDVGWRVHCPSCGQGKEEDRRKEGQEGFVQAVVFQRVAAVRSAKRVRSSEHCAK